MEQIIDTIKALAEQIQQWPSAVVLIVVLGGLAFFLRLQKWCQNKYIPGIVFFLGGLLNFFIGDATKVAPTQRFPGVILVLFGILMGFIAYVIARLVAVKFEKQVDFLKNGDTTYTPKPKDNDEPK